MTGVGHVGAVDIRQHRVPAATIQRLLAPQGRPVWVRVTCSLAAQLGQANGVFVGVKRKHVAGAQREPFVIAEKLVPLGPNQALWANNTTSDAIYIWTAHWGQLPPEED